MGEKATDRSFAGGELAPDMYGRVDLAKYQTGLALCRNIRVLPQGAAENRPGTEYVSTTKNNGVARLIPFTYNFTQTAAIEVGAGYCRFHSQAGTTQIPSPVTAWSNATAYTAGLVASSGGVNYVCILAHTNHVPPNATYWYALADANYEIPNSYAAADLMSLHFTQKDNTLTIVHPNYPVAALSNVGTGLWALSLPSFAIPTYFPTSVAAVATTPHTASWNPVDCVYSVTGICSVTYEESQVSASSAGVSNDLTLAGNINTITWTAPVTTATITRYNVYKYVNGLWGYIGSTPFGTNTFIDNNIIPNTSLTAPLIDTGFNDAAGNYPGAVCYYQQRKWFAGTKNKPQNVWATVTNTESNLTYSIPVQANNRLSFQIAAKEASGIQHLSPVANIVMLTPTTEWRLTSTDGSAVWAANLYVQPQSYIGAGTAQPVMVGTAVLFSQSRGSRIREMTYNYMAQSYTTNDLSVMAHHLFDYKNVVDMAFSKAPYPFLYCAMTDGTLAGLTYVPDQEVAAWHHHDFGGFVESICTITEQPAGTSSPEDMLYMVVRRLINGNIVRYIERMHTRYFNTASDAWFVDSGATNSLPGTYTWTGTTLSCNIPNHGTNAADSRYFTFSDSALSGTYTVTSVTDTNNLVLTAATKGNEVGTVGMTAQYQVSAISGLTWLVGCTVNILADGAPIPQQVVSDTGTITLPYPATKVVVGLPITAQMQTLPAALQVDTGFGETLMKNVNAAWLRVFNTGGVYVGPDQNNLVYAQLRANTDLPGNAPALYSGVWQINLTGEWSYDGTIFLQQTDPLPMTICSLAYDIEVR